LKILWLIISSLLIVISVILLLLPKPNVLILLPIMNLEIIVMKNVKMLHLEKDILIPLFSHIICLLLVLKLVIHHMEMIRSLILKKKLIKLQKINVIKYSMLFILNGILIKVFSVINGIVWLGPDSIKHVNTGPKCLCLEELLFSLQELALVLWVFIWVCVSKSKTKIVIKLVIIIVV
jgi:hypothetical protein